MRVLLDTHLLVWGFAYPQKLSTVAQDVIKSRENEILYSVVSIWEIRIKAALRRPDFPSDPANVLNEARRLGYRELPITAELAISASQLPLYHRDPFDRMLVAQALSQSARLMTADRLLSQYSNEVWLV